MPRSRERRDQLLAAGAVGLVALLGGLVVTTVIDARNNGRRALERLQQAQVQQLASEMDTRVQQAYQGVGNFAAGTWHLTLNDKDDRDKLDTLQGLNPTAKAGYFITTTDRIITAGTLLKAPVGSRVDRPGLAEVASGARPAAILPVGPGITTALPTIDVTVALHDQAGKVIGALVDEVDVSPDSAFNAEVKQLGRGRTGTFLFLDQAGIVIAASDPRLIASDQSGDPLMRAGGSGFRRGHGQVVAVASVPSAGWRAVFRQQRSEFEGGLTGPVRSALLLIVLAVVVGATVAFVAMLRALATARREQHRLRQINAAQEEFVSIVSHELRTPVGGLLGFLQTTLDHWNGMSDEQRREAVGRAYTNARRLHTLTGEVLDATSLEAGKLPYAFSAVDLGREIGDALEAARAADPEHPIDLTLPEEPVWVTADADRLQQVLTNLIDNAGKHSPPGEAIAVTVAHAGDMATVTVADHGAGMTDGDLGRIFDKFVRGRGDTTRGTGLGLYICRQIIDAHGGTISARLGQDGGVHLTFTLPGAPIPRSPVSV